MYQECFDALSNLFVGEPFGIKCECYNKRRVGLPIYQMKTHVICCQDV